MVVVEYRNNSEQELAVFTSSTVLQSIVNFLFYMKSNSITSTLTMITFKKVILNFNIVNSANVRKCATEFEVFSSFKLIFVISK